MNRNGAAIALGVLLVAAASGSASSAAHAASSPAPGHELSATSSPYDATPSLYDASALFNSGNAHARAGQPALAVLDYERARRLAPLDPDIEANLRRVRDMAGIAPPAQHPMSQYLRIANPDAMYWVGLLGLVLAGGAFVLYRAAAAPRRGRIGAIGVVGAVLAALSVGDALATASTLHDAVMLQPAAAGASPIADAEALFTEPAATLVSVRDEHAGFVLIRDPQGRDCWVARSSIAFIVPRPSVGSSAT